MIINKYLVLLIEIHTSIGVTNGNVSLVNLCKEHKCSTNVSMLLADMNIIEIKNTGPRRRYKWIGELPNYEMADKLIDKLREKSKLYYKRKILFKNE